MLFHRILTSFPVYVQDATPLQISGCLGHRISVGGRFGEDEMVVAGNTDGGLTGGDIFMLCKEGVRIPRQVASGLFQPWFVLKEREFGGAAGGRPSLFPVREQRAWSLSSGSERKGGRAPFIWVFGINLKSERRVPGSPFLQPRWAITVIGEVCGGNFLGQAGRFGSYSQRGFRRYFSCRLTSLTLSAIMRRSAKIWNRSVRTPMPGGLGGPPSK